MSLHRRNFLKMAGLGAAAGAAGVAATVSMRGFAGNPNWRPIMQAAGEQTGPPPTARNLIFVLLDGGASHVDTFDLKTGSWTPNELGAATVGNGVQWPVGYMPKLAQRTNEFSLVRSIAADEAVHERAIYQLITAHRMNTALTGEIPHFASLMSHKLANQRRSTDTLPTVVALGPTFGQNGFLDVEHRGLAVGEDGAVANLQHFYPGEQRRFDLLDQLTQASSLDHRRLDSDRLRRKARDMMQDPMVTSLLSPNLDDEEGEEEYNESNAFLKQCQMAVSLLEADIGVRVFQLFLGGWDHHQAIYNPDALPLLAGALDKGLDYLIAQLQQRPGQNGGTLLDETLICAVGEFGRTTGALNSGAGRDHWHYANSALFAGGGVKGGRIIGGTNVDGSAITDPGWSQNRFMGIADLMATLYAALGIDHNERFYNTPSGRVFDMVDTGGMGPAHIIDPLFS